MRHWLSLVSVCVVLVACGPGDDGGSGVDGNGGGDGASVVDSGGGSDADQCTGGTLCGQPATCCPEGNECIDGACLVTCDSGVRCGAANDVCCNAQDVCLSDVCATPGAACGDSYDCNPGEFCEPTLGQCLPQPDPLTCEFQPTFDTLSAFVEWSYPSEQIISPPVVADIDGDMLPEVVVNLTQQDGGSWPVGNILVLAGESGAVDLARIPHDPANNQYGSHGRSTIALGDVSGDGLPDIIYAAREVSNRSLIVAIDHTGALLWTSFDANGPYPLSVENGAATMTNFDNDPQAEIVFGATILDHTGRVVWDLGGGGLGGERGTNNGYVGGISAVADLDGDGVPEIVSGRDAWKVSWTPGALPADPPTVVVTNYWTYAGNDGYPAIADLDGDGDPEVILVATGQVIALNGQTGQLWCGVDPTDAACVTTPSLRAQPISLPGGGRGGPPTVADFDADGRAEVGVAGGGSYSLYDFNRLGEDIVQPMGDPAPAAGAIFVRWSNTTQDDSSNATGSSVFDFQGDGVAEVVYADECYMRVYSGTDGSVQLTVPNTSATIHEYPLVVDVDADGNSEILIVANEMANCTNVPIRHGLYVYGDMNDEWVPTRRVWTQHAYHVTNADSNGNPPMAELDNWLQPRLNNYRQNVQGDGVFNAPDLTIDLSVALDMCNVGSLVLRARVSNVGALGVPPGAIVTFHQGTTNAGPVLGMGATTMPLLPGASTTVSIAVTAPMTDADYYAEVDGTAATTTPECDLNNNNDAVTQAGCIVIE